MKCTDTLSYKIRFLADFFDEILNNILKAKNSYGVSSLVKRFVCF